MKFARESIRGEAGRGALLALVGFWLLHPFATNRWVGTGDALWYTNMLADFVTQWRAGHFPVFVGQTDFAFNGAVYPLRAAPLYQHLAGVIDFCTGHHLGFFTLQHLTVLVCGLAGIFTSYACLRALAPERPWPAFALAILYLGCPGVLGTIYTQDLYMTWMTVPFLPVAFYAIARSFRSDDWLAQLLLGPSLAALWWAHSPVALWATLIAVAMQLVRLLSVHRNPAAWKKAAGGAGLFVVLGSYPFVSVAALRTPGVASAVTAGLTQQERITNVVREVFPAVLLPVSHHARALSDLQLGYALGLTLLAILLAAVSSRRVLLWCFVGSSTVLLLLLLPVPVLNLWLWAHLPEEIKRITFYWPMHRFYLLLAASLVVAGQIAFETGGAISCRKGCGEKENRGVKPFLRSSGRLARLVAGALAIAVGWSLWEAGQFVAAGRERTATVERSAQVMRPENRLLMMHSFGLFPGFPGYFSHGVMDPEAETRLLDPDTLTAIPAVEPGSDVAGWQTLRGEPDANPGVLKLSPTLHLAPGRRYEVEFEFSSRHYAGLLQFAGNTFYREYLLPSSGEKFSFGSGPENSRILPLWTTSPAGDDVTLRFIPAAGRPADFAEFGRFRSREIDPQMRRVQVQSWLPFRARVRSPRSAWLETPRVFIPGYVATVDGHPVAVQRSPQGLVMVAVTPSAHDLELRYVGPALLRASYYLSLAAWLSLFLTACLVIIRSLLLMPRQQRP
jgi:hypothetical protein